jgi:uncharacterized protein with HEPN domain
MRDKARLEHIQAAISRIKAYTAALTEKDFSNNQMVQDAVFHQFSIIGEAIVNVDDEILQQYDYPWYAVRAFRNYIVHEYFGINLAKVWSTIEINLPELEKIIEKIIANNDFTKIGN